ncbi:MAG: hypothetical protein C0459_09440 [Chitinophaga sp.]|jgi:Protein of unknown function (DUF1572)|nr:hypothetical protein [Chitinophaga sp.]
MQLQQGFLKDVIKRFKAYKDLGDKTFEQLEERDFFFKPSSESNNIAIIIQHLHGNMLSRWTNFLTEDGEKEWRKRDAEFDDITHTKASLINLWNEGWACLLNTLENLQPDDLLKTITIRTEPLLVYDAILRQLAHYPYHVGQIVFIGTVIKNENWKSLSIPKGGSHAYLERVKQSQKN